MTKPKNWFIKEHLEAQKNDGCFAHCNNCGISWFNLISRDWQIYKCMHCGLQKNSMQFREEQLKEMNDLKGL